MIQKGTKDKNGYYLFLLKLKSELRLASPFGSVPGPKGDADFCQPFSPLVRTIGVEEGRGKMGSKIRNTFLILIALTFTACPQLSVSHVDGFPHEAFQGAKQQIASITNANPRRSGEASEIHLLVFDGADGDLVRIVVPLTMVEWGVDFAKGSVDSDDFEGQLNPLEHMSPQDLRKLGPGLLVQVDDESEDSHVLIWLS
ncbi:MAG: hypothetical protein GXO70_03610 [Acidobacteria bacterium]|nr:hypothetical protein [Acidobacteriota bacterium]